MTACNARPPQGHPLHGTSIACHMAAGHEGPHPWAGEPSLARQGIDALLRIMPNREIELIDAQKIPAMMSRNIATGEVSQVAPESVGPWVLIRFVGGDEFAVWKATGAVYRVGPDGAVEDDPLLKISREGTPSQDAWGT